ncbi:MAG: metallophosphoesterase [Pseudomonadota bacterium]
MSAAFSIAHVTDAHLPGHGRFAPGELMGKRLFSALNWVRKRHADHLWPVADMLRADVVQAVPDHVAMTGDVVNFGLVREFAVGAEWLSGFGDPAGVSFAPGNHEAIHGGVEAACAAAFAPFTQGDEGTKAGWPWLRRRGPVALIGVSTSIATAPFLAQGLAGAAQRSRLAEILDQTRDACRIVLIHHPPTAMSIPRRCLRDRVEVSAVIADIGAELVLHGHNHRNQLSWIDGPASRIPVLGAPSASVPYGGHPEPAEWRMITIEADGTGWSFDILRRGLTADGSFADIGRFRL